YTEARGGLRQELHEAAGVFARNCFWIEFGFGGNDADDEVGVHAVVLCSGRDEISVGNIGKRRFWLGAKNFFGLDGHNFGSGKFSGAAVQSEFVSVPDELVAGDNEALAAFEDDVFGARGGNCEHEKEKSEERKEKPDFPRENAETRR